MQAITSFLKFIIKPKYIEETILFNKQTLKQIFALFIFEFLLSILLLVIVYLPLNLLFNIERLYKPENNFFRALVISVLTSPILEEFAFRYWLKNKKLLTLIFIALVFYSLLFYFLRKNLETAGSLIGVSFLFLLILAVIKYKQIKHLSKIETFYLTNYWLWFYLSAITFGFVHIFNYKPENNWLLLIPLTLSQLTGGLVYGYVRIKYGMWANISMHMVFNFILLILRFTLLRN